MSRVKSRRKIPLGLIYVFSGLLILALLIWSFLRALQENDTRQVSVDMPGQGFVTINLTTDPYPPIPSGIVQLNLMGMNSRNVMVDLGPEIPFTFGPQGSDTLQGRGIATSLGDGNYRAGVQFNIPGTYWMLFDLSGGEQARFQIKVEPAQ